MNVKCQDDMFPCSNVPMIYIDNPAFNDKIESYI